MSTGGLLVGGPTYRIIVRTPRVKLISRETEVKFRIGKVNGRHTENLSRIRKTRN